MWTDRSTEPPCNVSVLVDTGNGYEIAIYEDYPLRKKWSSRRGESSPLRYIKRWVLASNLYYVPHLNEPQWCVINIEQVSEDHSPYAVAFFTGSDFVDKHGHRYPKPLSVYLIPSE